MCWGFEDKIIRKAWFLPEENSFLPLLWLLCWQITADCSWQWEGTAGCEGSRARSTAVGCRRAPERTCRAGTALLSRCAPWSFHHISGMLWQCLCWEVKLQNPEHVDAVVWKFTSSFLSIQSNLAKRCLFSIQLLERLQITFQCWIFLWSVRMCCVCQNYFIQVC